MKECPDGKILNPATNRCVKKDGKIGKKLVAKKPVAKKPVAKKLVAKKPVAKKPVAKKPVAKKPVAKKPVAKKPMAKKPTCSKLKKTKDPKCEDVEGCEWIVKAGCRKRLVHHEESKSKSMASEEYKSNAETVSKSSDKPSPVKGTPGIPSSFRETGVSRRKEQDIVIENSTPKLAKELKKAQGNIEFSPSINRQLMTLKSLTPRGNIYDCPDDGVLITTARGSECYSWKTKEAKEVMLKNLNTTKPVSAKLIIAPAQYQSNCWMNAFFVSWFLSDLGRKFNRWFRQTCITGILPDSKKSIPNQLKKPAFLLNKMIDASLRSKTEGDPARYAELMDTNNIIRQFHRAIPDRKIVKTKKRSNPLTFYSTVYTKMLGIVESKIDWLRGYISYAKGPMGWLRISAPAKYRRPPSVKELNNLIGNALITGDFIPKVIFLSIFDNPSKLFHTPEKIEFTLDRRNIPLSIKNVQPGKKYSYKLDAAVLRNTTKSHCSAYITINGVGYGFDGESYSRLEKFDWRSRLNKNTAWRFAEIGSLYFNFKKGYQLLIYYRDQ